MYDKGIVQNTLNYMSLTKKLFFRLVPRSEIKRFGVTFRFKSSEFDQTDFKNLDLEKKLRLITIIVIFSLFTKMMQHMLLLKKTGTATLIFTVQVHNLAQTNIQKCSKNMV